MGPPADRPVPALDDALRYFTPPRIAKIAILAVLFVWLFHQTLWRLALRCWQDTNWGHGLIIPVFSVGIFLSIAGRWLPIRPRANYWGLSIVAAGLLLNIFAVLWAQLIYLQDLSWLLLLGGIVVMLCGIRFTWAVWFPLAFLLFGIPLPGQIYNPISTRLQQVSAQLTTVTLHVLGIRGDLDGVIIDIFSRSGQPRSLQVAEACSGMHILMAFAALGTLIAYMVRRPWWHRLTLLASIPVVAIISNTVRVTAMGLLHYLDLSRFTEGHYHTGLGLMMLVVALLLYWPLHKLLCKLVVEPSDAEVEPAAAPAHVDLAPAFVTAGPPGGPASSWRSLAQPQFLVLAGFLLVTAAGWGAAIRRIGLYFVKEPVPLRMALDRFPREVPDSSSRDGRRWVAVRQDGGPYDVRDELIDPGTEDFLGARHPYRLRGEKLPDPAVADPVDLLKKPQYISRVYTLMDAKGREVDSSLRAVVFIGFYTGLADPVAHVPERCYLGGGFTLLEAENTEMDLGPSRLPVRRIQFGKGDSKIAVVYFFHSNGELQNDHFKLRLRLADPRQKYAYFAKVEVRFLAMGDLEPATVATRRLLKDFWPILQRDFLPDWQKYAGK